MMQSFVQCFSIFNDVSKNYKTLCKRCIAHPYMLEAICTFQYEIFAGNRRESGGTGGSHTSNSWTCRRQLLRHHLRTEVNICWFFLKWKFLSVDGETVRPTRQAPLSWNWWLAGERWHFHFFIICYGWALRTIRSPRAEGLIYSNLNWNASGDWGNLWTRIPTSGHDGHAQREIWAEGKFSPFPDFELVVEFKSSLLCGRWEIALPSVTKTVQCDFSTTKGKGRSHSL